MGIEEIKKCLAAHASLAGIFLSSSTGPEGLPYAGAPLVANSAGGYLIGSASNWAIAFLLASNKSRVCPVIFHLVT